MSTNNVCVLDGQHAPIRPLFDLDRWHITQCGECGLIMTGSAFEDAQYEAHDYYTIRTKDVSEIYFDWGFRWRWVLNRLRKFGGHGALLDVGAGNGLLVKIAKEEFGWRSRGIELSLAEVEFAKAVLDVEIERLMLSDIPEKFDAVTSFNVLEHVIDPQGFLREISERVESGGLLVLSTPNPASIKARVKGLRKWGMISPPHHINIFTRKSLELAVDKAGFDVISYDSISSYIRFLRRWEKEGTLMRGIAFNALRLTGLGADHLVIARKR